MLLFVIELKLDGENNSPAVGQRKASGRRMHMALQMAHGVLGGCCMVAMGCKEMQERIRRRGSGPAKQSDLVAILLPALSLQLAPCSRAVMCEIIVPHIMVRLGHEPSTVTWVD